MLIVRPYEKLKDTSIFIDVRSPEEYKKERIIDSINIPLFTDEERAVVGTAYKQNSVSQARRLGVEIISQKLTSYFDKIEELIEKKDKKLTAYCARGGYRSTFFASAFSSIGMNIFKLDGGYKKYRKYIYENLPKLNEKVKYIVIHGNTGVGKTEILNELENLGEKIIDLEKAANHRGSFLGGIGLGDANTQKNFESILFNYMDNGKDNYIFLEAESRRIGNVMVPPYIHDKMKEGIHIYIEADMDKRTKVLKEDYIKNKHWQKESLKNIERLNKYIPKDKIISLKNKVIDGDFDYVARELMLNYYDPLYQNKSNKYTYDLTLKNKDSKNTAEEIIKWKNNFILKS